MLGDNIFTAPGWARSSASAAAQDSGATVFAYAVDDSRALGVVEFDPATGTARSIEEKPVEAQVHWAVTGLYFSIMTCSTSRRARPIAAWRAGDYRRHRAYLDAGKLQGVRLGRGFAWLDTGTHAASTMHHPT